METPDTLIFISFEIQIRYLILLYLYAQSFSRTLKCLMIVEHYQWIFFFNQIVIYNAIILIIQYMLFIHVRRRRFCTEGI